MEKGKVNGSGEKKMRRLCEAALIAAYRGNMPEALRAVGKMIEVARLEMIGLRHKISGVTEG